MFQENIPSAIHGWLWSFQETWTSSRLKHLRNLYASSIEQVETCRKQLQSVRFQHRGEGISSQVRLHVCHIELRNIFQWLLYLQYAIQVFPYPKENPKQVLQQTLHLHGSSIRQNRWSFFWNRQHLFYGFPALQYYDWRVFQTHQIWKPRNIPLFQWHRRIPCPQVSESDRLSHPCGQ